MIGRIVLDASAAIHLVLLSPYAKILSDHLARAGVSMTPDLKMGIEAIYPPADAL